MDLKDFDYELPDHRIATHPLSRRSDAKLMVVDRTTQKIHHSKIQNLKEWLNPGDLLIANNSRVIRARLVGKRKAIHGGKVECLLLRVVGERVDPWKWEVLLHASVRNKVGMVFECEDGLEGRVVARGEEGVFQVEFSRNPLLSRVGQIPLPPYIVQERARKGELALDPRDEDTYQTVYAKSLGSAAAPTAGLHFTQKLLEELNAEGISWAEITLHVGLGTFRPVKVGNLQDHRMHEEDYSVPESVIEQIGATRGRGGRIVAVGTTTLRALESAANEAGELRAGSGRTDIFIYGDYRFKVPQALLTNFHLPRSTLLMLVSAFGGHDLIREAYQEAIASDYRFFSYGDAMLILR